MVQVVSPYLSNNLPTASKHQDFSFGSCAVHSKHHLQNRTMSDIESSTANTTTQINGDDDSLSSNDGDYVVEESDFQESDSEMFVDSIQECDIWK